MKTIARSDFLKEKSIEIAGIISSNFDEIDPKNTYDIIGLLAEEREILKDEIQGVVVMVMAKLLVDVVKTSR